MTDAPTYNNGPWQVYWDNRWVDCEVLASVDDDGFVPCRITQTVDDHDLTPRQRTLNAVVADDMFRRPPSELFRILEAVLRELSWIGGELLPDTEQQIASIAAAIEEAYPNLLPKPEPIAAGYVARVIPHESDGVGDRSDVTICVPRAATVYVGDHIALFEAEP